ncbi:MAG: metal ABC transporter substrate-binding protein [Oscillospiraceae bacterium]|nr:metal ABC transporter substrate-binding protein [Oscillospiraceae bacterium]
MKRLVALILAAVLPISAAIGCSKPEKSDGEKLDIEKISIVCTIFPQYDWVRQILGNATEIFELTLLIDNRIDLHNYQPSVDDIVKISSADLFVYVGGESDGWVEDIFRQAMNPDMAVINLLEVLGEGVKIEEIIAGMDHEGENDGDGHDEDEECDEHVWLSLKNAQIFCAVIADALAALDPDNVEVYQNNLAEYIGLLSSLDAQYQTAVSTASYNTLLFGDRFPFRYLVDDYGIGYYAAFPGCSAETEASFETIVFLSQMMDELDLPCVMVTESSDQTIARTIIQNTTAKNHEIGVLDAMQSVKASETQGTISYLSIMESNLEALKEALK